MVDFAPCLTKPKNNPIGIQVHWEPSGTIHPWLGMFFYILVVAGEA